MPYIDCDEAWCEGCHSDHWVNEWRWSANESFFRSLHVELLLQDHLPQEFASTHDALMKADCGGTAFNALFSDALHKIRVAAQAWGEESPTRKQSKDCYVFQMEHNYALTRWLAEQGWRQWSCQLQWFRTKEECEQMGVKYRTYRYSVHAWEKDGLVVLAKVKLDGKYTPAADVEAAVRRSAERVSP